MANKYFKLILFIVVFFSFFGEIMGQTPPPPKPGAPIDGGIIGLLILGAGYAIKKLHNNSKD